MKRFVSTAISVLVLLASTDIAQAATRTPTITLSPLTIQAATVVTSQPGCEAPASVDDAPSVEVPSIAADQGVSGTTELQVDLTPAGNLTGAGVLSSSGNQSLDAAALRMAHFTRFTAEMSNCKRVGGSYRYVVEF